MEWVRANWFWVVFGVLFLWVHMKMHGSHGGHGGHAGHGGHGGGRDAGPLNAATREGTEDRHAQH